PGCGGFQRRSPTGGAANGMPLNARTPQRASTVPSRIPSAVRTRSEEEGPATPIAARTVIAGRRSKRDVVIGSSPPGELQAARDRVQPRPRHRCLLVQFEVTYRAPDRTG